MSDDSFHDKLLTSARGMRHEPTAAEDMLWERLRRKALDGLKIKRQYIIGQYIVDFYCSEAKLVIELDGSIHQYQVEQDAQRQAYLEDLGMVVLRFSNEQVFREMNTVLSTIAKVARGRMG